MDALGWEKRPQDWLSVKKKKKIEHLLVFLVWCDRSDHSKDAQGDCGNFFVASHLKGTEKFE